MSKSIVYHESFRVPLEANSIWDPVMVFEYSFLEVVRKAKLEFSMGLEDQANRSFDHVYNRADLCPEAIFEIGKFYADIANHSSNIKDNAIKFLEKTISLDPENTEARKYLDQVNNQKEPILLPLTVNAVDEYYAEIEDRKLQVKNYLDKIKDDYEYLVFGKTNNKEELNSESGKTEVKEYLNPVNNEETEISGKVEELDE